jgi:glycosyltransferase involved in cell wall biosynthesis
MRIAQLAPLFETVPPARYGGTERVVSYLTEELARRGHDVTLFASGDSVTRARLAAVTERAVRQDDGNRDTLAVAHTLQLAQALARACEFDVIHCHVDHPAFPYSRLVSTPILHTLHGRLDLPYLAPLFRELRDIPLVSISDAQRAPLAGLSLRWAGTVHHGLPLERYPFSAEPGTYLAFLGRLSPEKRPDLAIEIARRVGLPIRIAAKADPTDRAFFEAEIRPLLDDPLVEYLGEIGDDDKPAFLAGALALLFPIDWPEPFGLAMIEAMACGTPVIARPCGAVPEVVVPGRTGFVGESIVDLVDGVKRIETIDRAECRRHVEALFSAERMADGYEALYQRLVHARAA